jgi:preprotein translocase subunit SecG
VRDGRNLFGSVAMFYFLFIGHLFLCVLLIGLVLIQQGKGAELGATLSGSSNSLFGAGGAVPFIARLTTGVAVAFMVTSLLLVRYYSAVSTNGSRASSPEALLSGSVVDAAPVAHAPSEPGNVNMPEKKTDLPAAAGEAKPPESPKVDEKSDLPAQEKASEPQSQGNAASSRTEPSTSLSEKGGSSEKSLPSAASTK